MNSILTRLLAWQIGTLIVTAAFITALTYQLTWSEFSRDRDLSLEQVAWAVMRHHGMHPEIYDLSQRHRASSARSGMPTAGSSSPPGPTCRCRARNRG